MPTLVWLAAVFGTFSAGCGEPSNSTAGATSTPSTKAGPPQGVVGKEIVLLNGLKYVDLVLGTGKTVGQESKVYVQYIGRLKDGSKYVNTRDKGKPVIFFVNEDKAIRGLRDGVQGMRVGGKRKLIIPPELAYGDKGSGDGKIPPNAELTIEIEVLNSEFGD